MLEAEVSAEGLTEEVEAEVFNIDSEVNPSLKIHHEIARSHRIRNWEGRIECLVGVVDRDGNVGRSLNQSWDIERNHSADDTCDAVRRNDQAHRAARHAESGIVREVSGGSHVIAKEEANI